MQVNNYELDGKRRLLTLCHPSLQVSNVPIYSTVAIFFVTLPVNSDQPCQRPLP